MFHGIQKMLCWMTNLMLIGCLLGAIVLLCSCSRSRMQAYFSKYEYSIVMVNKKSDRRIFMEIYYDGVKVVDGAPMPNGNDSWSTIYKPLPEQIEVRWDRPTQEELETLGRQLKTMKIHPPRAILCLHTLSPCFLPKTSTNKIWCAGII